MLQFDALFLFVLAGAVVAGFIQGLSGFAFSMVAMAFWAWALDPKLTAVLTVFGALVGQIVASLAVRRGFNLRLLLPFVIGGLAGIPVGVALLPMLNAEVFKAMIGAILVIWCSLMLMSRRLAHLRHGGRLADGMAGLMGGVMGGLGGLTGVIPTLWCTLRGFERDTQRNLIQSFNLAILLVTMGTYVGSGIVTRDMIPLFLAVLPAILIPTMMGARVYMGISDANFRRIVLGLLTLSGFALLASAIPKLL